MRTLVSAMSMAFLLAISPAAIQAQRDEDDKSVAGKKASEWIKLLETSKEVRQRHAALLALTIAGPQTRHVFDKVGAALLNDSERKIRVIAAQAIRKLAERSRRLADPVPITDAMKALRTSVEKDKETTVRAASALALGRIASLSDDERDDEINENLKLAVPVLGKALADEDPTTRAAIAEALGRMGTMAKGASKDLINAFNSSGSEEMLNARLFSLYAIGQIGKPEALEAVNPLLTVLKGEKIPDEVRRKIAETLGYLGEGAASASQALSGLLKHKNVEVRRAAAQALDRIGKGAKDVIPTLIEIVERPSEDKFVRCHAMHTISQLGQAMGDEQTRIKAVTAIQDALGDSISDVRLAAVQALGYLGKGGLGKQLEQVKGKLLLTTRDLQPAIRAAAKEALKRLEKE